MIINLNDKKFELPEYNSHSVSLINGMKFRSVKKFKLRECNYLFSMLVIICLVIISAPTENLESGKLHFPKVPQPLSGIMDN